ncbi:hypothetical protein CCF62_004876 [Salmonella enterica]|nr:hypothetical protein [Salmonella enterica]
MHIFRCFQRIGQPEQELASLPPSSRNKLYFTLRARGREETSIIYFVSEAHLRRFRI